MIVFSTVTRNQREFVFTELLPSVLLGNVVPDLIHIWDNSEEGDLPQWASEVGADLLDHAVEKTREVTGNNRPFATTPKMVIEGRKENTQLARVWNHAISMSSLEDHIILSNDDIVFLPDTIEKLVKATAPFVYPHGARSANSFSLYKISKAMWEHVGPFDEQFIPAYFEDNDYHRRMILLGYDITPIEDAEYIHKHGGSLTRRSLDERQQNLMHMWFRRNQAYYIWKWGGLPHHERYTLPYNGMNREEAIKAFNRRYVLI